MAGKGGGSVIAAVFGNGFITVIKLAAFFFSGSGAMLAEGIHSFADTLNQALLWFGIRRSQRPADKDHPYGYGAERYFWALVSAMGIFVLGCGVTVYHGVHSVLHPHMPEVGWLTWVVLAVSAAIESVVLGMAVVEANKQRDGQGWITYLRQSSDPTIMAVLFEDSIAVAGVFIAAAGIGLCYLTGNAVWDGIASIVIGLSLGALALALAIKNKQLLIGRAAAPHVEKTIHDIVAADPAVKKVLRLRTRVLAAGEHLIDLQVDFEPKSVVERLKDEILEKRDEVQTDEGLMAFAHEFGNRLIDEMALEVDRLEDSIRAEVPTARMIDVEGD
jgi:zinc transporter 9